jgi:Flp pilus assembly protein TadG
MSRWKDQAGTAALELALLLVLLVPVLFGIIDVGHALYVRVQVQEAAQEGAMVAVYAPDVPATTRGRVLAATPNVDLVGGNVHVSCPAPGIVQVRVTHPHTWLSARGFFPAITMTAVVEGDIASTRSCVAG